MCGIAGFWIPGKAVDERSLLRLAQAIRHRGPDDHGTWKDDETGVGLTHRRLSILDLSPAGHQPMASRSGRYVLVFNGEIYNHLDLRRTLEAMALAPECTESTGSPGSRWRGHSDTETLLAAFEAWGVRKTLDQTVGMFAFALWDRNEKTLSLARDRLGEKPLYYGYSGNALLFGSELKALVAHPVFKGEIDRTALTLYMRHNYIPTPYSIYQGIRKLPAGSWVTFDANAITSRRSPPVQVYWSAREAALAGRAAPFLGSQREASAEFERLLLQSIRGQMVADVPLGAFLSGGIDSSTVVALMQRLSSQPVRSFTIGFREASYNEATFASAVAAHLGTEHTELYVSPEEALAVIPRIPDLYDEPFADSSQIPTYLVSRLARSRVTVSLSGDGGDELLGGYTRYVWASAIWRRISRLPRSVRGVMAMMLTTLPPETWTQVFARMSQLLPRRFRHVNAGDKLHKLADLLGDRDPEEIYYDLISHWRRPIDLVVRGNEGETAVTARQDWPALADFENRMMYLDMVSYLPDDILVKVDRAAMGVSLETRVPMLDHRVVEFALSLPLSMKIHKGRGKVLLREVLGQYVPASLIERPKMGFGVPIDVWLRGPLKSWAEDLLQPSRLAEQGFLRSEAIQKKWTEHLSEQRNWAYHLWDVLMFQAWLSDKHG